VFYGDNFGTFMLNIDVSFFYPQDLLTIGFFLTKENRMKKKATTNKNAHRKNRKPLPLIKKKKEKQKPQKAATIKKEIPKPKNFSFGSWLKNAFGVVKLAKVVHELFL
jgi:hypothetical protein